MTDNLIGKRVRATLGENVLVGELRQTGDGEIEPWRTIDAPGSSFEVWDSDGWELEPLPDPLPTALYSLVVPPADQAHLLNAVILEPHPDETLKWVHKGTEVAETVVQELIANGWRVIPGPAE